METIGLIITRFKTVWNFKQPFLNIVKTETICWRQQRSITFDFVAFAVARFQLVFLV